MPELSKTAPETISEAYYSLTAAEKVLGKKEFAEVMSAFITRAPGAPKLAMDSDPRPAYDRLEGFKPEED